MAYIFHNLCRNMDFSTLLPLLKELWEVRNDSTYNQTVIHTHFKQIDCNHISAYVSRLA